MSSGFNIPLDPATVDTKRAVSGGEHWKYDLTHNGQAEFTNRIAQVLASPSTQPPRDCKNWTGFVKDRITVVRYSHRRFKGKESISYWVVRCVCGNYEMRKNISLGHKKSHAAMCEQCKAMEVLKRRAIAK